MTLHQYRFLHQLPIRRRSHGYEKIDQELPPEQLALLRATCCPLERHAMLEAGYTIIRFYQDIAPRLAQQHGLAYPDRLERMMIDRLRQLLV